MFFKKLLLFSFFLFLFNNGGFAQISQGGTPHSFTEEFAKTKANSRTQTIPEIIVPAPDMEKIYYEDSIKGWEGERVGVHIPLQQMISLTNSGHWVELDNGDRIWRVKFFSENAESLTPIFEEFYLPPGAKLFLYNCEKTVVRGGYTSENNINSGYFYPVSNYKGNCLIVEYLEPKEVIGEGKFEINRVTYDYKKKNKVGSINILSDQFGTSLGCQPDINCPQGNEWQDEKKGVVKIVKFTNNGRFLQSGSLVNNTNLNGAQFLLTSYHGEKATSQNEFDLWKFIFNYEIASCGTNIDPDENSISGAKELAKWADTDFQLLEIIPAIPPSYNVYYNGWDAATITPAASGVGIHHPRGDVKKIAIENEPLISLDREEDWPDGTVSPPNSHWVANFNSGETEQGSSGSPFFNSGGKIVGQLHGGSGIPTDCTSDRYTGYGKFNVSWEGGRTQETSLQSWLDPVSGGRTKSMEGAYVSSWASLEITELVSPTNSFSSNDEIIVRIHNSGPTAYDLSLYPVFIKLAVEFGFNDGTNSSMSLYERIDFGVLGNGAFHDISMGTIGFDNVRSICINNGVFEKTVSNQRTTSSLENSEVQTISGSFQVCIAANPEDVVANFNSSVNEGSSPLNVQFNDLSIGNPTSWNWTFPGGTPSASTLKNPSVNYSSQGVYDVSLEVSNGTNSNKITRSGLIKVDVTDILEIRSLEITSTHWEDKPLLFPQISTTLNLNELVYEWTPAEDFYNPKEASAILFYKGIKPDLPLTKTYSLKVSHPGTGLSSTNSISVTLFDCENKEIYKDICVDNPVKLGSAAKEGETYSWSPGSNLSSSSASNPTFTPPNQGLFTYTVTITSQECVRNEVYYVTAEGLPEPASFIPNKVIDAAAGNTGYSNQFSDMIQTTGGSFYVGKYGRSAINDHELFKFDKNLNVIWSLNTGVDRLAQIGDEGCLTLEGGGSGAGAITAIRRNKDGQVEWEKVYLPIKNRDYAETNLLNDGGKMVYVGRAAVNSYSEPYNYIRTIYGDGDVQSYIFYQNNYYGFDKIFKHGNNYLVVGRQKMILITWQGQILREMDISGFGNSNYTALKLDDDGFIIGYDVYPNLKDDNRDGDYGITRLDPQWNILWNETYGGDGDDGLMDILQTSDKGFLLLGSSNSPASGVKSQNARNNSRDYWVVKIDQFGRFLGDGRFGSNGWDVPKKIFDLGGGSYLLAGAGAAEISGDKTKTINGASDMWFVEIKDQDFKNPDPNPESTEVCENFSADFNNSTDPVRNEVISIGGCSTSVTFSSGANFTARASTEVIIKAGTTISNGAYFRAHIGGLNLSPCDISAPNARLGSSSLITNTKPNPVIVEDIQVVDVPVGTDLLETNLMVFPNPASKDVEVQVLLEKPSASSLIIYNLLGRVVYQKEFNNVQQIQHSLSVSDWIPGYYTINLISENKILHKEFVVVH